MATQINNKTYLDIYIYVFFLKGGKKSHPEYTL